MLNHEIVPVYITPITIDKIINALKEIDAIPETKTIYIPNKGLATIPIKEYRKMMFGHGCLICSKEMEERINKAVVEDFHSHKLFSKCLSNKEEL